MSKKVRQLQTLNTHIQRGEVEFNAPTSYDIIESATGKVINTIAFQKGPVKEVGVNGVFLEDLLLIAIDQIEHFQASDFACEENADTLQHLRNALATTRARQYERQLRDVQGKYLK